MDLTVCQEIGKTPVWFLSNIRWLERVSNTKFGVDVSNEKLKSEKVKR